uniref:Fucolectin tachylectin-4 pentraxin-1 domain-containing protein n=1 Tax=Leptobrachium leishanense TaxID=445787 RepID=A0A8C5PUG8_9ANUR
MSGKRKCDWWKDSEGRYRAENITRMIKGDEIRRKASAGAAGATAYKPLYWESADTGNVPRRHSSMMLSFVCLLFAAGVFVVGAEVCTAPIGVRNLAKYSSVDQSSLYDSKGFKPVAELAIDGNDDNLFSQRSCMHTSKDDHPWWKMEMEESERIGTIVITNRKDCCRDRLKGAIVYVGDSPDYKDNAVCGTVNDVSELKITVCCKGLEGKFITVVIPRKEYMAICEFEAFRYVGKYLSPTSSIDSDA